MLWTSKEAMRKIGASLLRVSAALVPAVTAFTVCGTAKTTGSKAEEQRRREQRSRGSGEVTERRRRPRTSIDVRSSEALKETGVEPKAPEEIGDFHLSHVQQRRTGSIVRVFYGGVADTDELLLRSKKDGRYRGDYTVYPETETGRSAPAARTAEVVFAPGSAVTTAIR